MASKVRDYKLYCQDIAYSLDKIAEYTKGYNPQKLKNDQKTYDAVMRNFQIIGEAIKHLPAQIKKKHAIVEWQKIVDFRNIVVHEYFGISIQIVWSVISEKLPELKQVIAKIQKEL